MKFSAGVLSFLVFEGSGYRESRFSFRHVRSHPLQWADTTLKEPTPFRELAFLLGTRIPRDLHPSEIYISSEEINHEGLEDLEVRWWHPAPAV